MLTDHALHREKYQVFETAKPRVAMERCCCGTLADFAVTATGTAEVGGWTTRELLSILDGLEGLRVVGADIVEVAPIYDNPGETTVLAAAEVAHSLMTLMVQTPVKPIVQGQGTPISERTQSKEEKL